MENEVDTGKHTLDQVLIEKDLILSPSGLDMSITSRAFKVIDLMGMDVNTALARVEYVLLSSTACRKTDSP